jgi:hypothetical protein
MYEKSTILPKEKAEKYLFQPVQTVLLHRYVIISVWGVYKRGLYKRDLYNGTSQ